MADWHVTVEYRGSITAEQADALVRGENDAAVPVVTSDAELDRTILSFRVDGSTLREATDAALRRERELTAGVVAASPIALHVRSDEIRTDKIGDVDRQPLPELIDSAGVRTILGGVSQRRLVQLQRERPDFPDPVERFGGGRGVWDKAAVEAFAQQHRGTQQHWGTQPAEDVVTSQPR